MQEKSADPQSHPTYSVTDMDLQRKGKWMVRGDASLRTRIIKENHDGPGGGHSGRDTTRKRINQFCYWKGQTKDID